MNAKVLIAAVAGVAGLAFFLLSLQMQSCVQSESTRDTRRRRNRMRHGNVIV